MKAYIYQRKLPAGGRDKRWSYRLREIPKDAQAEAWPEGLEKNGTKWASSSATRMWVESKIQEFERNLSDLRMGKPRNDREPITRRVEDYLTWGRSQGGVGGLPWAAGHAYHVQLYLNWWVKALHLQTLTDINQGSFRAQLVVLSSQHVPSTVNSYARKLTKFCKWCIDGGLMREMPIRFKNLDNTPQQERGAFSSEELKRLMSVAPPWRALLYRFAGVVGFRKTAISTLQIRDMDWENLTVRLHFKNAKNRKTTIKPVPPLLAQDLYVLCEGRPDTDPLIPLHNPKQAVKRLHQDMKNAHIPIFDAAGRRRDFHSLKAALGTMLDGLGLAPGTIQKALDHGSFRQTQTYIKRDLAPLRAASQLVDELLSTRVTQEFPEALIYKDLGEGWWSHGESHSPICKTPQNPATPTTPQESLKPGTTVQFQKIPQDADDSEQNLLARLYHRLQDPVFAAAMAEIATLPTDIIQSLLPRRGRESA